MQIMPMQKEHLPEILKVETESFSHPWTENMFLEELSGKTAHYHVAMVEGHAVGYMGMWLLADEGHITNVAVARDFRRQGIGEALVDSFIALAREHHLVLMTLEVRTSNESAIFLYEKKGFVPVGRRKNYYDNIEDAILMTKYF